MPQVRGHHDTGVGVELRGFAPIGLRPVGPTPRRECWSDGVLEYWNQDTLFAAHHSNTPRPIACQIPEGCGKVVVSPQLLDTPVRGLAAFFKIPTMACVNKFDLNEEMTDQIEDYCVKHQIEIVGRIPYVTAVTHAMVAGKSVVEFTDGSVFNAIKGIWHKVEQTLKG